MHKLVCVVMLTALAVAFESGCATKKYVRNRVAERVTPLENRTGELEETSRRNTQQIGELRTGVDDARSRTRLRLRLTARRLPPSRPTREWPALNATSMICDLIWTSTRPRLPRWFSSSAEAQC